MTKRPLFHPTTATELKAYGRQLPHGILLHGKEGIGLETAAQQLADHAQASIIRILPEYDDKVDVEKGRITIGVIRRLYELVRTKSNQRRCVIITATDTITTEAQHAFLKLLEEPADNTTFILLCHHPQRLLPTVLSRVQQLQIRRIDRHQSELLLDSLKVNDAAVRSQILFIAEGLPGRITTLASSPGLLEAEATKLRQARSAIQGSAYQRMVIAQEVKDDRSAALAMVSYMIALLRREVSGRRAATTETIRLLRQLEAAHARLEANGNVRLVLAAALA